MGVDLTRGLPREKFRHPELFDEKLPPVDAPAFPEAEPAPTPKKANWLSLKIIGILVSAFASFVTAVNSYEWFASLRPWWVAFPMAITMIGASVFLPDFGIVLIRDKKRLMGAVLIFSGVIATSFCMVTTVAALYNTHSWRIQDAGIHSIDTIEQNRLALAQSLQDRERIIADLASFDLLIQST